MPMKFKAFTRFFFFFVAVFLGFYSSTCFLSMLGKDTATKNSEDYYYMNMNIAPLVLDDEIMEKLSGLGWNGHLKIS